MTTYRRLLCPVDFSDVSHLAIEWSTEFAREVDARLSVLHVLDVGLATVGNLVAVPDAFSELRTRAEERFLEWKKDIDLTAAEIEIVEGAPDEAILSAAKSVDLLVMGTHGLSGIQKLLLGSVTEKVLHRVDVPLLTLSPRTRGKDGELLRMRRPKTILLAVDFGDDSQSVVRHGVWLAEHYGADLVAAHFVPVPYVVLNDRTLERLGPVEIARLEESLTADRRRDLEGLVPSSSGGKVDIIVQVGMPFDSLRDLVALRTPDLVVMGAGGHGHSGLRWLGSTVHKMVRAAECPVLIVR
jgi:nucleotide-binding universal stress UspA family protein